MIEVLSTEGFQTRVRENLLAFELYQDEAELLVSGLPREPRICPTKLGWRVKTRAKGAGHGKPQQSRRRLSC